MPHKCGGLRVNSYLTEGAFTFEVGVDESCTCRLQVTLIDGAGLESDPVDFLFDVASPTAPSVTQVVLPATIGRNQAQHGIVRFEDSGGDIVEARFEALGGDPSAVEIQPGMSFDPGVHGQTDGTFRFTISSSAAQTVTLRLTLADAAGLESDPYEFTFEVQ